jgi:lipoprotein-anchoring transpeptidase ErfK/SrfK
MGIFNGQRIIPPRIDIEKDHKVLGDSILAGMKHIYVDLTSQTLYAYEGDNLILQTLVSTGKWFPTPTGDFKIWIKLRATRMTGGNGADYYDLPNVPYVMYFANDKVPKSSGFGLHGAYWHNNFGHPMSHGCVNMRVIDAQKLYDWVPDPKDSPTLVTIYGRAPL